MNPMVLLWTFVLDNDLDYPMIQNRMEADYMVIQISLEESSVAVVSIVIEMDHRNYSLDKMNMELNNDDRTMDYLWNVRIDNHLNQAMLMDHYMLVVVMMVVDKDVDEYDDDVWRK